MEYYIGLVKGRHEIPVTEYFFDGELSSPLDFQTIEKIVWEKVEEIAKPHIEFGLAINQASTGGVAIYMSDIHLYVYVTGLTSVVAEVISACAHKGVKLTLMHYDRDSGNYLHQRII